MGFSKINLVESVIQGVYASGYATPTAIQAKAIPAALVGRDILGCAPTGTGKTAAFVLPILDRLVRSTIATHRNPHPRALILTPTRELAQQIEDSINKYGMYTSLTPLSIYGGVSMVNQLKALKNRPDIIIATPGRLLDHLERRSINLSCVEVLVLDEADRMYDMGFIHDVRRIISQVPAKRQTMLFSATMSKEIRALVASIQHNPELVDIGIPTTPTETVEQIFFSVEKDSKLDLLTHILQKEPIETMLVFSRTKHGADRIAKTLERRGISSATIHSNRSQPQRQRALDGFKAREFRVLVATDIAARGIDIHKVSHVVNYDTPAFPEDYVHRIGRTGRAEEKGKALTFVSQEEEKYLNKIAKITTSKPALEKYPGFNNLPKVKQSPPFVTPSSRPRGYSSQPRKTNPPHYAR